MAFIIAIIIFAGFYFTLWRWNYKARYLPMIAIGIIVAGIGALCQPWILFLYRYGLAILITGVVSYVLVSHFE